MSERFHDSLREIGRRSQRGDYASARQIANETLEHAPAHARTTLIQSAKSLEVLESLGLVRRLMRQGDFDSAANAATQIQTAVTEDDYSDLSVASTAAAMLSRAGELANRSAEGDRSPETIEEIDAFVTWMGDELDTLADTTVERPIRSLLDTPVTATGDTTLRELLKRQPWESGHNPVTSNDSQVIGQSARVTRRTGVPVTAKDIDGDDGPVIGRILIEQEQQAKTAPLVATGDAGQGNDVFDIITRAALKYWYVVAACAMLFGFIGSGVVLTTPDKYESSSILQRTERSEIRAQVTGDTEPYLPELPQFTILRLATIPRFYKMVATRLTDEGWTAPDATEKRTFPFTDVEVSKQLTVEVDTKKGPVYHIEFTAIDRDSDRAQALAGAASDVFREFVQEEITSQARQNLKRYETRSTQLESDLKALSKKRLDEFQITDDSIGVTTEERIKKMVGDLADARKSLSSAEFEFKAAKEEVKEYEEDLKQIEEYRLRDDNPKIAEWDSRLSEVRNELAELLPKRRSFGPKHPIHDKIAGLREEEQIIEQEIEALKQEPVDGTTREKNPVWVATDSLATQARARARKAELEIEHWKKTIPHLETGLEKLRSNMLDAEALRRKESTLRAEQERNRVVREDLISVIESADQELKLIQPADRATPVEKKILIGLAIGLVIGLVVGIGIAIGLFRRRQARMAV